MSSVCNFQALCFQILTTVGVGVYPCLQNGEKVMTTLSPGVEILRLETHNPEAAATRAANTSANAPRYQHRYPNGTQCRLRGPDLHSGLCLRHFREKFTAILPTTPSDSEDLS